MLSPFVFSIRWWWFQRFGIFILTVFGGNDPIWRRFFQKGWNHQLVFVVPWIKSTCEWCLSTWHRERFCIAGHLYRPRFLKTNPVWNFLLAAMSLSTFDLGVLRKRSCHIFSDRMNWIWLKCMNIRIFCDKLPLHLGSWLWWMLRGWVASKKILLMAENAANQLRLVFYPIIYKGFIHPRWLFVISEPSAVALKGRSSDRVAPMQVQVYAARVEHANQKSFFGVLLRQANPHLERFPFSFFWCPFL